MHSQAVSPSLAPALDSDYEGDAAAVVEYKVSESSDVEGRPASSPSAPTSPSSVGAAGPPSSSRGRDRKRVTKSETNADRSVPTTPPAVTSSSPVSHKRTRSTKTPPTTTAAPVAVEGGASRFDQYAYSPSDKDACHADTTTTTTTTASTSGRKRGRSAKAK